jgi:hypothetical protein
VNAVARMRMLVENADDQTAADPGLLRIIARAHHIQARLIAYSLLRLPWLAPGITTAIVNGRKPPQLTAQTLMRLTPLVENADDQTPADPSLLRILARAHHIQARLIQNPKLTMLDIAREEQVSAPYLYSLLRLPWLAPDITTAIINGRKPPQLTAKTLMRLTPRLPAGWAEQRKLLGFR